MRSDVVWHVLDEEVAAARRRSADGRPRVLDVGGGSGVWAVPLATTGCLVTVIEPSPNALATLRLRAAEAGVADRIVSRQGDTDALAALVSPGEADLVLCHGVLEFVDNAQTVVTALAAALAPGGALSLLVANWYAAIVHHALSGRLAEASALLDQTTGSLPGEAIVRRFDTEQVRTLIDTAGLAVDVIQGDGVVADAMPTAVLEADTAALAALERFESAAARRPPLRDIASRVHALGRQVS